ncbi:amidohydrolase [Alkalispirochaeta odontotermitis]|nr:amidohydrolase [Alkalispirochaeta odontotermitis]CAB1078586.1 FIG01143514: hypothetical protein [Olavius algarvensis Delta 1 endosymbiont]
MSDHSLGSRQWLDQVQEDIIDPEREIVDPHHHLWRRKRWFTYLPEDFWTDTGSGHNVTKTVYVQCRSGYRTEGPEHLKPVGETEFVADVAEQSRQGAGDRAQIAGIVSHANLLLGDLVEEILDAHEEAGQGLFKGIRHAGAREESPAKLMIPGLGEKDLFSQEAFRQGVKLLGRRVLTYESWHYHHQIKSFIELARSAADTLIIQDHFGTPLGVGPYRDNQDEIFREWQKDIAELARCENVYAKLGGMAMPDNGFGWHLRAKPPTSDEFVKAQQAYYLHTIECFGPRRCMFESNFPVDRLSISYPVLFNGFKKIVADFSEDEKDMMFSGTATRVYKL